MTDQTPWCCTGYVSECPLCPEYGTRLTDPCRGHPVDEPNQETVRIADLHARRAHPDFEYATTRGPRKQWDDPDRPPAGESCDPDYTWEPNLDAGRPGMGWDRFEYHEEAYWRRPKKPGGAQETDKADAAPAEPRHPTRHAARSTEDHVTDQTYPYQDGEVTVLGPEIFASSDGAVISWKGENYVRQAEPKAASPAAAVEFRDPCPRCEDCRLIPRHEMAQHQRDHHPETVDAAPDRLAESGVRTPGHDGMGVSWHGDDCPWRRGVLDGPAQPRHCPCEGKHFPTATNCRWCKCHRTTQGVDAPVQPTAWTPPPPGSTRNQLPDHILNLIRPYLNGYTSTACQTAHYLAEAIADQPEHRTELAEWRERMQTMCRHNQKYTGEICPHHATKEPTP